MTCTLRVELTCSWTIASILDPAVQLAPVQARTLVPPVPPTTTRRLAISFRTATFLSPGIKSPILILTSRMTLFSTTRVSQTVPIRIVCLRNSINSRSISPAETYLRSPSSKADTALPLLASSRTPASILETASAGARSSTLPSLTTFWLPTCTRTTRSFSLFPMNLVDSATL
ncbi:hypothetical protein BC830DRAFT_1124336 [Chytriomyces sp. MP71]|nr:hypothetical protein BC830DRAFT_1124336 [Chytriomyces sp. MP71]